MKLTELLFKVEIFTNIYLYESKTRLWNTPDETLISNKATVKELYKSKYKNYEVIGITTEANALRITIYKGKSE